jgi:hypothetical protein
MIRQWHNPTMNTNAFSTTLKKLMLSSIIIIEESYLQIFVHTLSQQLVFILFLSPSQLHLILDQQGLLICQLFLS